MDVRHPAIVSVVAGTVVGREITAGAVLTTADIVGSGVPVRGSGVVPGRGVLSVDSIAC
jgi:hypothetical protein